MFSGKYSSFKNKTTKKEATFGFIPPNKELLLTQMDALYPEEDMENNLKINETKGQFKASENVSLNFRYPSRKDYKNNLLQRKKKYHPKKFESKLVKRMGEILRSATPSRTQLENSLMRTEPAVKTKVVGDYIVRESGSGRSRAPVGKAKVVGDYIVRESGSQSSRATDVKYLINMLKENGAARPMAKDKAYLNNILRESGAGKQRTRDKGHFEDIFKGSRAGKPRSTDTDHFVDILRESGALRPRTDQLVQQIINRKTTTR